MGKKNYSEAPLQRRMEPEFEKILEGGPQAGATSYAPKGSGGSVNLAELKNVDRVRKSTGHGPQGTEGR